MEGQAAAPEAVQAMPSLQDVQAFFTSPQVLNWLGLLLVFAFLYWLLKPVIGKARSAAIETAFSNWRVALLGTTGLVLSAAAGWTTWDGMHNFTGEPVLSGMITFGIQGVMLIVAWLIGESFATGMHAQGGRVSAKAGQGIVGAVLGALLFGVLILLALQVSGQVDIRNTEFVSFDWSQFGDTYLLVGGLALVLALIAFSGSDLARPYVQGSRIIIRNAMLWVMFLVCMATSVFFAFDSRFNVVFPQEQRVRTAELRAQNQVAGVVADIGQTIETRRLSAAEELFANPDWQAYETQLAGIASAARDSEGAIEAYFNEQIEARNRAVKEQQERIVTAQTGQAGLESRKSSLAEELARLRSERPGLAAEAGEKKSDVDAKGREVDAKRVEALAEDKGVEGTGKEGRGPIYRERMAELGKLQAAQKIAEERFRDAQRRLTAVDTRLATVERELSTVDGELAKFKGEAETAGQRIKLTEAAVSVAEGQQIDPARMAPVFEKARADFRQEPTVEKLAVVQQVCGQITSAMASTEATKARAKEFDCNPEKATEASAALFALNAGAVTFDRTCEGGDKIAPHRTADALFGFARTCLSDSGLPGEATDALRTRINYMEMNRDDKAHRFVVSLNAFQDGNRLAYLALAIAIGLDTLILMSGLFGASAVRSPLSDVPRAKARSAQQLEASINAALGVRQYETASLVLATLRPTTNVDGFSAQATLDGMDRAAASRLRQVLTAGADIGAVETVSSEPETYRVRSELREYLSTVCDKALKSDPSHARRDKLGGLIRAALKPHPKEHAELVAHSFEPIKATEGFTSTVSLRDVTDGYENRIVRRVVNAGATLDAVAPDKTDPDRYYIRPDLYEVLLDISAHDPASPAFEYDRYAGAGRPAIASNRSRDDYIEGGALSDRRDPLSGPITDVPRITHRAPEQGNGEKPRRNIMDWLWGAKEGQQPDAPTENDMPDAGIDQSRPEDEPSDRMRSLFRSKLELTNRQLGFLLDVANVKPAAQLGTQLGTIADNDVLFADRLAKLKERKRAAVEEAVQAAKSSGEPAANVDTLAQYLTRLLPAILLVEHGGYERALPGLINDAEALAAKDFVGGAKSRWLAVVQEHRDEFSALPRSEPDDWPRVQECLRKLSNKLAELNGSNDTPRLGQRYMQ